MLQFSAPTASVLSTQTAAIEVIYAASLHYSHTHSESDVGGASSDSGLVPIESSVFEDLCFSSVRQVFPKATCWSPNNTSMFDLKQFSEIANRIELAQKSGAEGVVLHVPLDNVEYLSHYLTLATRGGWPPLNALKIPVVINYPFLNNLESSRFNIENNLMSPMFLCQRLIDETISPQVFVNTPTGLVIASGLIRHSTDSLNAFRLNIGAAIPDFNMPLELFASFGNRHEPSRGFLTPISSDVQILSWGQSLVLDIILKSAQGIIASNNDAASSLILENSAAFAHFIGQGGVVVLAPSSLRSEFGDAQETEYERELGKLGVIFAYNHSVPAAWTKLSWLIENKLCTSAQDYQRAFITPWGAEVNPMLVPKVVLSTLKK